jgi:hypothetical protein
MMEELPVREGAVRETGTNRSNGAREVYHPPDVGDTL